MAIRIVDGVPGSGKTYYTVHHLIKTYFEKDEAGFYVQKKIKDSSGFDTKTKLIISTNIEGLKVPHVSLDDEVQAAGGIVEFFSHSYQERLERDDETRIYLIDEAQKWFRNKVKGDWTDVWFYFEKHRHFGHDVYMITQKASKIHAEITSLIEHSIHAKPRIRSVTGELPYQVISEGEVMKRFGIRPRQEIFDLYKSRRKGETEKISNPIMKTVGMACIAIVLLFGISAKFLYSRLHPDGGIAQAATIPVNRTNDSLEKNDKNIASRQNGGNTVAVPSFVRMKCSVINRSIGDKGLNYYFVNGYYFPHHTPLYEMEKIGLNWYALVPAGEVVRSDDGKI